MIRRQTEARPYVGFKMRCGQQAFNPWQVKKANAGDILQIDEVEIDPKMKASHNLFHIVFLQ